LGEAVEWYRLRRLTEHYDNLNHLSSMNDSRVPQVSLLLRHLGILRAPDPWAKPWSGTGSPDVCPNIYDNLNYLSSMNGSRVPQVSLLLRDLGIGRVAAPVVNVDI
jgi:hypothetical protein